MVSAFIGIERHRAASSGIERHRAASSGIERHRATSSEIEREVNWLALGKTIDVSGRVSAESPKENAFSDGSITDSLNVGPKSNRSCISGWLDSISGFAFQLPAWYE